MPKKRGDPTAAQECQQVERIFEMLTYSLLKHHSSGTSAVWNGLASPAPKSCASDLLLAARRAAVAQQQERDTLSDEEEHLSRRQTSSTSPQAHHHLESMGARARGNGRPVMSEACSPQETPLDLSVSSVASTTAAATKAQATAAAVAAATHAHLLSLSLPSSPVHHHAGLGGHHHLTPSPTAPTTTTSSSSDSGPFQSIPTSSTHPLSVPNLLAMSHLASSHNFLSHLTGFPGIMSGASSSSHSGFAADRGSRIRPLALPLTLAPLMSSGQPSSSQPISSPGLSPLPWGLPMTTANVTNTTSLSSRSSGAKTSKKRIRNQFFDLSTSDAKLTVPSAGRGAGGSKGAGKSRSTPDMSMSISPTSEEGFPCHICGQVFSLTDRLAKHMASRHRNRDVGGSTGSGGSSGGCETPTTPSKSYLCEVCKRSFARSDMLTRHMRLHTGLKPYTCKICGQVFSRSDHLSTHQRTHTGEKPYKCPQCPYAACRRDMITRHMRTHARYPLEPDSSSPGPLSVPALSPSTVTTAPSPTLLTATTHSTTTSPSPTPSSATPLHHTSANPLFFFSSSHEYKAEKE